MRRTGTWKQMRWVGAMCVFAFWFSGCRDANDHASSVTGPILEMERTDEQAKSSDWAYACGGSIPYGSVAVGQEAYGPTLYAARAWYGGGLHPGKVRQGFTAAKIPYGGLEVDASCYEVFVGAARWVTASGGSIPAGAIVAGQEANGTALYAARAWYAGGLHPGKVRPAFNGANISYAGKEIRVWSYEVLTAAATPPPSGDVLLSNVPYQSQLSASCTRNNLCGYAASVMITAYLHRRPASTTLMQDMAAFTTGSRCPTRFSDFNEFTRVTRAAHLGNAPNAYWSYISYDQLKQHLRNGKPVHIGLQYGGLGGYRCSTDFSGGHSVVVVGFSEARSVWYIHDPYCRSGGAFRQIPDNVFRSAISQFTGSSIAAVVTH